MPQMNQFMASLYWPYLVASGVVLVSTVAIYRLFFHPLAGFPGPKLAAVTRSYEAYYDVVCNGQYTFKIAEMHKKYGPIVRISPYELHISDPDFYDKIYSREGEWDKYAWAYDAFGAPLSTICAIDHNIHKHRRAAVNPFFSKATVAAKSDIISRLVEQLCTRIDEFADESSMTKLSLSAAISALTRDVATEFILGKRYKNLEVQDFNQSLAIILQNSGSLWRITKHLRWYGPLMQSIPMWLVERTADQGVRNFFDFLKDMVGICSTIDSALASGKPDPDDPKTIIHQILDSNLPKEEKSFKRICDDVETITGAAFETTANSIRMTLYHIYSDPEVVDRLRAELNSARQGNRESRLGISSLEQLPYLTAVLLEGLRISPATATRANRVASNRELSFGGRRIPAKTPVGMTTYLMHRDPNIYPDPEEFKPQRWLDLQERWRLEKFYAPFSKGPRNCLGMHLAWAELYMTVAAVVERFDLTFGSSALDDLRCTSDQFIIGTSGRNGLPVAVRRVKG
ncbi:cytochrome P450 [Xylaria bambusicola]|uniref:cytochrome P450 n=1 Tax=Xylaria bambusicola TaxID=326684 RepID=UPI0020080CFC|nr:cytochrome P450 [Xylaria bambusicola]KAI0517465.1 cytochrome P450 [Xylaria bambusicola]